MPRRGFASAPAASRASPSRRQRAATSCCASTPPPPTPPAAPRGHKSAPAAATSTTPAPPASASASTPPTKPKTASATPDRFLGFPIQAPILFLPNVFEASLCRRLIAFYETDGGADSGVMRDVGGQTVGFHDAAVKRRRDCTVADPDMMKLLRRRIIRRVIPEIWKIHRFHVTRMERYLIGCYTAEDAGHFRPHRDDTTKATAHRRFAVSVSLNDDFSGGELSFPEYGKRGYRMPPGGAVVFSGALMHAVSPVTRGRRYAFLPFLYDDAAAQLRERNSG